MLNHWSCSLQACSRCSLLCGGVGVVVVVSVVVPVSVCCEVPLLCSIPCLCSSFQNRACSTLLVLDRLRPPGHQVCTVLAVLQARCTYHPIGALHVQHMRSHQLVPQVFVSVSTVCVCACVKSVHYEPCVSV